MKVNLVAVFVLLSNCLAKDVKSNFYTDVCSKEGDHNRVILRKCIIPKLYELAYLNFGLAYGSTDKLRKSLCSDIGKQFSCVEEMGGFCQNQDHLGPNILKYLKHLCTNPEDFSNLHQVIRQLMSLTSDQISAFNNDINPCLKEANHDVFLEKCLLGSNHCESSYKFMAFEDSYVCLISALHDVKGINMDEVIKASSLAIKVLKLEIGKDPFCSSKLSIAKRLCHT